VKDAVAQCEGSGGDGDYRREFRVDRGGRAPGPRDLLLLEEGRKWIARATARADGRAAANAALH